jgi:hypothetical protein
VRQTCFAPEPIPACLYLRGNTERRCIAQGFPYCSSCHTLPWAKCRSVVGVVFTRERQFSESGFADRDWRQFFQYPTPMSTLRRRGVFGWQMQKASQHMLEVDEVRHGIHRIDLIGLQRLNGRKSHLSICGMRPVHVVVRQNLMGKWNDLGAREIGVASDIVLIQRLSDPMRNPGRTSRSSAKGLGFPLGPPHRLNGLRRHCGPQGTVVHRNQPTPVIAAPNSDAGAARDTCSRRLAGAPAQGQADRGVPAKGTIGRAIICAATPIEEQLHNPSAWRKYYPCLDGSIKAATNEVHASIIEHYANGVVRIRVGPVRAEIIVSPRLPTPVFGSVCDGSTTPSMTKWAVRPEFGMAIYIPDGDNSLRNIGDKERALCSQTLQAPNWRVPSLIRIS